MATGRRICIISVRVSCHAHLRSFHPWLWLFLCPVGIRNGIPIKATGLADPFALLTYNLVNYLRDAQGVESVGSSWNSTTVYRRRDDAWKTIHSHWSFTRHDAFRNLTPEASEGLQA